MAFIGFACKTLACFSVAGGLIASPQINNFFSKEKEKVTWLLGKSSKGSAGLFLEDMEKISKLFIEKKKKELTVEEVGLKFGERDLSSKDILKSPCEDGKYYLLRHVDNSGQYELKKGLKVWNLICGDNRLKDVEYVDIKWGRPKSRNKALTIIRLSNCRFAQAGISNISIICNKNERLDRLQFTFTATKNGSK